MVVNPKKIRESNMIISKTNRIQIEYLEQLYGKKFTNTVMINNIMVENCPFSFPSPNLSEINIPKILLEIFLFLCFQNVHLNGDICEDWVEKVPTLLNSSNSIK